MNAKYLDHIYKNHSNILESQSGLSSQILHPSFATACNPKLTIHCAAKEYLKRKAMQRHAVQVNHNTIYQPTIRL
ncbi:hypothetical protein Peur_010932 [Populus x canadensis]